MMVLGMRHAGRALSGLGRNGPEGHEKAQQARWATLHAEARKRCAIRHDKARLSTQCSRTQRGEASWWFGVGRFSERVFHFP